MLNLLYLIFFFFILSTMLILINYIVSKSYLYSREKLSPFECGFDPMSKSRIPYSNQFFMISLMFLIFDIEITLMIPLIFMMNSLNNPMIMSFSFFLMILISGLYIEYMEMSLDWKY